VLGQQCQVDETALSRRPGDPGAADRAAVEQDQFVRGVGEARLPPQPLSAELQVEEGRARGVLPLGDVRPRRCEELTQERLVGGGDRTPFDPGDAQFREGKMPSRAMR
jgi:hypothetical protein